MKFKYEHFFETYFLQKIPVFPLSLLKDNIHSFHISEILDTQKFRSLPNSTLKPC